MVPSVRTLLVAWLAALLLCACTSLQLVDPYDPEIAAGLDDYDRSMSAFLTAQGQEPTSAATLYGSEDSRRFYRESEATLSNVILHAEAASNQATCAPQIANRLGLPQLIANVAGATELEAAASSDPRFSVRLEDGSCTVVALKVVRANHYILEAMHKKHGRLSRGAATLAHGLIEDSIRIALRIEAAKRG